MNTEVSIYKYPVVLDKGQTKERCDCGGQIITRLHARDGNIKVQALHCTACTQDYFSLEENETLWLESEAGKPLERCRVSVKETGFEMYPMILSKSCTTRCPFSMAWGVYNEKPYVLCAKGTQNAFMREREK
jgi:hypothetical protein